MARVYFRWKSEWAARVTASREALARGEKVPEVKEKAPERGYWYADYQGADGGRRQERLPTATTRKEAEGQLRELEEKA